MEQWPAIYLYPNPPRARMTAEMSADVPPEKQ